MKKSFTGLVFGTIIFCCLLTFSGFTSFPKDDVTISIEPVAGDVYCLYGQGGNIGILKGKEALLVVDSQYAGIADRILTEIKNLSPLKIHYLVNTHYHGDHVQGNPIIGKGAQIISHNNCKASMLKGIEPGESPESIGAPQKTFDTEMTISMGDETVKLLHIGPAHTSGDTIVVFTQAKVIHAGDLFFYGMPPYIDVNDGSDTQNWILLIRRLAEKFPECKVIPGHGKVTDMKAFLKFADYLQHLRTEVAAAIKAGKTREQAMETITFAKFDFIQDSGKFLTKKENVGWVYDEMTRK